MIRMLTPLPTILYRPPQNNPCWNVHSVMEHENEKYAKCFFKNHSEIAPRDERSFTINKDIGYKEEKKMAKKVQTLQIPIENKIYAFATSCPKYLDCAIDCKHRLSPLRLHIELKKGTSLLLYIKGDFEQTISITRTITLKITGKKRETFFSSEQIPLRFDAYGAIKFEFVFCFADKALNITQVDKKPAERPKSTFDVLMSEIRSNPDVEKELFKKAHEIRSKRTRQKSSHIILRNKCVTQAYSTFLQDSNARRKMKSGQITKVKLQRNKLYTHAIEEKINNSFKWELQKAIVCTINRTSCCKLRKMSESAIGYAASTCFMQLRQLIYCIV